ncbi:hypothetical protein PpBr36_04523 [Pyricularia pennisetigena]|uniref:hypothetical protein n=1 Tax=Pyricularia pennisetigena TaxID=1578925 RepID=UPI00114E53AB|nr:hypothetical protein PpBr36_04523 [Pyricularia pennisetigena]TLS26221.1 hypothetical protein PpBr36_04523 [Pyricularia pennisetigena]
MSQYLLAALKRASPSLVGATARKCRWVSSSSSPSSISSSRKPAFPTIESCPPPTCSCQPTPNMAEGFEIDHGTKLNGLMPAYQQHVLVCTGKDDWASKIEDEDGGDNLAADLRGFFGRGGSLSDPYHNVSVLNASFPSSGRAGTSVFLLPDFKLVPSVERGSSSEQLEGLAKGYLLPEKLHNAHDAMSAEHREKLVRKPELQRLVGDVRDFDEILVLICGHGGRDQRCGIYGPLLRTEFERALSQLGVDVLTGPVDRVSHDGVNKKPSSRVGLISHIGGHKFAGNVIIYLPPSLQTEEGLPHPLAGHGIWYGRVEPRHVEGIIRETVRKGNSRSYSSSGIPSNPDKEAQPNDDADATSPNQPPVETKAAAERTANSQPPPTPPPPEVEPISWLQIVLATLGVGGTLTCFYYWAKQQCGPLSIPQYLFTGRELNTTTFVPFTVVSKEPLTDNSFIITLRPRRRHVRTVASPWRGPTLAWLASLSPWRGAGEGRLFDLQLREHSHFDVYERAWRHGLWAVEVKQPQLQIVREYTPLPPHWADAEDQREAQRAAGEIRLYVRNVGEVSNYLARKRPGSIVELRGPYLGFDVAERLGDAADKQVVFLAGGTGIAPAMQVAHRLLDGDEYADKDKPFAKPEVQITWANRLKADTAQTSSIMRQLAGMRQRHGKKLGLQCVVDEEKKFIDEGIVGKAISARKPGPPQDGEACPYHSSLLLQHTTTDSPVGEGPGCRCEGPSKGRNLLFVSGPDGFINHLAGEKLWRDGMLLQGPVGGLLAKIKNKYPDQFKDWLVLKL